MKVATRQPRRRRTRMISALFASLCLASAIVCVLILVTLVWNVVSVGAAWLSWNFLSSFPSRNPEQAGILSALAGSLWLITIAAAVALPVGIGAALYLEEYAAASRWRGFIQTNIANLAGVPSIVYGILGLGLFVQTMELGPSVLAGSLTMALVVLPIVILATQEALRAVPDSIRHASYALGATRWQTVSRQVVPAALPGIMTGVILALSRVLGEAAPLVAVGAVAYAPFVPAGVNDQFSALPIQIFNWTSRPQAEFHQLAAAAIVVLLVVLTCLNVAAVFVRYRFGKHARW